MQKYKKNISSYTAKVSQGYDCIFRVRCYKLVGDRKVFSAYSDLAYSSKPVYPAIYVTSFSLKSQDYGFDNNIEFYNNSSKTIKYVYFTVAAYNAVDDKVIDSFFDQEIPTLKATGPIKSNERVYLTWGEVWYNPETAYAKILKAKIEYTDGTSKTITLNVKGSIQKEESIWDYLD